MNQYLMSVVYFLGLATATAYADIGVQLGIKANSQGKPAFGVQYAYDTDTVWTFTYTSTITNDMLSALPAKLKVNAIDTKTGAYLDSWKEVEKSSLIVGSLKFEQKSVLANLLISQRNLAIVFAVENADKQMEPKFNLNIGKLCADSPDHFVDLTNGKKGCGVESSDLPDWMNECKDLAAELLDYVKQELISCKIAQNKYRKEGCGELSCQ
jgi:hypothetical protein